MENVIIRDICVIFILSMFIDFIVIMCKDLIKNVGFYFLGILDYNLVYVVVRFVCKCLLFKFVQICNYNKLNEKSFKCDMENVFFYVVMIFDDLDDLLWLWNKIFL